MANNNKVTIGAEPITIPAAQFSRILAAAVYSDYLRNNRTILENRIVALRAEIAKRQAADVNRKTASDAGAPKEPQLTTTNADEIKTDAGALTIETEGRVSGGERAELDSLRKERDELKAKIAASQNYEAVIAAKNREIEAVKEERNRLNAKVNELIKGRDDRQAERDKEREKVKELKAKLEKLYAFCESTKCDGDKCVVHERLAVAERCIEDCEKDLERSLVLDDEYSPAAKSALAIIRAYRAVKEAR